MGHKQVLIQYKDPLITAQSMASSFVGTPINIQFLDNFAVQVSWSGSNPIGTINFQVSLDYSTQTKTGTWSRIQSTPGVDLAVYPGGASGNCFLDFNQVAASWIQVTYTTTAGSIGALSVVAEGKEV